MEKFKKVFMGLVVAATLLTGFTSSGRADAAKGPHVTVNSADLEPFSLDKKTEPREKKPVLYHDDNVALDFNDNSEPNLNMRF